MISSGKSQMISIHQTFPQRTFHHMIYVRTCVYRHLGTNQEWHDQQSVPVSRSLNILKDYFGTLWIILKCPHYSPVVEDDQGIQLRKKWYKGKFLLLQTTFNGQQHIQNPKKSIVGKKFYNLLKFCCHCSEKQHFYPNLCSVIMCLGSKILIYMGKQLQYICQQMICDGISIVLYCVVMVTFYFGGLYLEKVTK